MTAESQKTVTVEVKRLSNAADLPLPRYATPDSAAVDLLAAIEKTTTLGPGERTLIPTGLMIALPPGYEAQVRPRSGLALKHGLTLPNSPGTIDADYRGEIGIIVMNLGQEPIEITRGMRIAQMVVAPVTRIAWEEVSELEASHRGDGGFGSTGTAGHAATDEGQG